MKPPRPASRPLPQMCIRDRTCTAQTRLLVPASRYEEAARIAAATAAEYRLGDPMEPGTTLGPLASKMQQDLLSLIHI